MCTDRELKHSCGVMVETWEYDDDDYVFSFGQRYRDARRTIV